MNKQLQRLGYDFYNRPHVLRIARELIGKVLVTQFEDGYTSGRIVEVEAYEGEIDRASHAWNGRRTARTEVMYGLAGTAYVYLIYGIHYLFNIVTNEKDQPHAILIRALEPLEGIDIMLARTGKKKLDHTLTRGPGNVSKAMGILKKHTGHTLLNDELFVGDDHYPIKSRDIVATPRIGVDYAGEHAKWNYRFYLRNNPYVSGKNK